jgi:hypothetical protein
MPHVNAVLQTAAATGVVDPPLLTRWILDPGSNCHVTNTRGTDWISTKKGGPSDVVFMSYDGTEPVYADRQTLREVVKILDVPEPPEETDQENEILLQSAHTIGSNTSQLEPAVQAEQAKDTTHALPSLKNMPEPEPGLQLELELELELEPKSIKIPRGWEPIPSDAEAPGQRSNNAPRRGEIGSQLSKSNVPTKRMQGKTLGKYFVAFAAARQLPELQKARLHRDQLLPPLKRWRDLEKQLFRRKFMEAEAKEFKRCQDMDCFKTVSVTEIGSQTLPLMWVLTYKFDEDGQLYKYKARLVVRPDLQEDRGDAYAAALAARVFRFLMRCLLTGRPPDRD